ncbi:MAG: hypothetical protein HOM21_10550 [Halobacteriovoraceae bacterium]|jgi:PHD/YefM family antitoxin component YafN of YafNO toxin-antitoxin module|nr:hypothetical protein [Halobacteriovoraceae bacterium]
MNNSTVRNFRENLKAHLDTASTEPVAITRSGERYILMGETHYNQMKQEISTLQKSLITAMEAASEKLSPANQIDEIFDSAIGKSKAKKPKKNVG